MAASVSAASRVFLDQLDAGARELLLRGARPVSFVEGAQLVSHGQPARGAFILRTGSAEACIPAPGGERVPVAQIGPGGIFGEMALVDLGTCTATVRATAAIDGWYVAHEDFRAMVAQRDPAARDLQHAITLVLAAKLQATNERLDACDSPEDLPARVPPAGGEPLARFARRRRASFDLPAFLPALAFFEKFTPDEIDEVAAAAAVLEPSRGQPLFLAGGPADAAFLVVRGAVEIVRPRGDLERRVAILGPGRPFGFIGALLEAPHGASAYVRESATILEISRTAFRDLYFGQSPASPRLRAAVQKSLLESLARTNRALTRLESHARLRAAIGEASQLEAVRLGQLWMQADQSR